MISDNKRHDILFDKCIYFMYLIGGGPVDSPNRNVWKQVQPPFVSDEKICFFKCFKSYNEISAKAEPKLEPEADPQPQIQPQPQPESKLDSRHTDHDHNDDHDHDHHKHPHVNNEAEPEPESEPANQFENKFGTNCLGEWKYPPKCVGYECDYRATWESNDERDYIMFTISTKNKNKWTEIGFLADKFMPETDAILGLVEESGRFFLMNTWLESYFAPPLDQF